MRDLSDSDNEDEKPRRKYKKFDNWEDEFAHLEKFKNKEIVNQLSEQFGVYFMNLRCVNKGTLPQKHPNYWVFNGYRYKDHKWEKILKQFNNCWSAHDEHVKRATDDPECVQILKDTLGLSFLEDIRHNGAEYYLVSDNKVNLKYEDKVWTKYDRPVEIPIMFASAELEVDDLPSTELKDYINVYEKTAIKKIAVSPFFLESYPAQVSITITYMDDRQEKKTVFEQDVVEYIGSPYKNCEWTSECSHGKPFTYFTKSRNHIKFKNINFSLLEEIIINHLPDKDENYTIVFIDKNGVSVDSTASKNDLKYLVYVNKASWVGTDVPSKTPKEFFNIH